MNRLYEAHKLAADLRDSLRPARAMTQSEVEAAQEKAQRLVELTAPVDHVLQEDAEALKGLADA